jgi:PAS domain S-box-containing protein
MPEAFPVTTDTLSVPFGVRSGSALQRPTRSVMDRAEQLAQTGSWEWNLEDNVLLWSDNMFRLLGLEPGEITPTPEYVVGRIHPEDRKHVERELDLAKAAGILPDVTYRIVRPDGALRTLRSFSAVAEERGGRPLRLIGSVQDITELAESQRTTKESLSLLETLQSVAPVGFAFLDCEFRIVRINETLAEVNGAPVKEQIGRTVAEVVPDLWAQMGPGMRQVLQSGEPVVNVEIDREGSEGRAPRNWLSNFYRVSNQDEVMGIGVVVVDVTKREKAERLRAAVMDTMLEGLYVVDSEGRLTFMNAAASKLLGWSEEELRGKSMHSAVHFQNGDGTPHLEADCEMLKVLSGGRAIQMVNESYTRKDGTICPVSCSVTPLMGASSERGVVVVFRDATSEQAEVDRVNQELDKLAWVGRIRDALDQDRLRLFSQPIIPLNGGRPSQELLLRMVGTGGEIIAPGSFLPVAERYGLIGEIDRWVIGEAIRLAAGGQCFAANLSAESISHLDLLPLIEQKLRDANTDPSNLIFEITETALVANVEAATAFADGLIDIGCNVALDDFGTGFGSFTYLKNLPITFLKIDVNFVLDLATNGANQNIVEAIVGLAHSFDLQTIAEGVEDAETLALLEDFGVDFAQGFHLGRPAPTASWRS